MTGGGFDLSDGNGKVETSMPGAGATSWVVAGTHSGGVTVSAWAVCVPSATD